MGSLILYSVKSSAGWLDTYTQRYTYTRTSCASVVFSVFIGADEPFQGMLSLPVEWADILYWLTRFRLYENLECSKILAFEAGSLGFARFRCRSEKQNSDQDQRGWDTGWERIWLICSHFMVKSALSIIVFKSDLCSMPFLPLLFCDWCISAF